MNFLDEKIENLDVEVPEEYMTTASNQLPPTDIVAELLLLAAIATTLLCIIH